MSIVKTFTANPISVKTYSFYPRNYDPVYTFVMAKLSNCPELGSLLKAPVKSGSTPSAYLFRKEGEGIPFLKTSAISRYLINLNDLYYIDPDFHAKSIKRSIVRPYDVVFTMTGKFMGKAALSPPIIEELNISQNSVVLQSDSPLKAAYISVFLNSPINRTQIKGEYSITKQKFLNQTKVSSLKVVPYNRTLDVSLENYVNAIDEYYNSVSSIRKLVQAFSLKGPALIDSLMTFNVQTQLINKQILLPNYYRPDVNSIIAEYAGNTTVQLNKEMLSKGNEIGSAYYLEEGTPVIKTSDFMNFDIDYEPDCYCSEAFIGQLKQNIKKGDILFTKDGKSGEVAIVQEDANVVISSGIVKYRASSQEELYWLFILLSSKYGRAYFTKWFVIASTMAHLRKDFFSDFQIPLISNELRVLYIEPLQKLFNCKEKAYNRMMGEKEYILEKLIRDCI